MSEPVTSIFKGRLGEVAKKAQSTDAEPVFVETAGVEPTPIELPVLQYHRSKTGLKGRPRKKEEEKAQRIGISLYPETLSALDAIQQREKMPRSALIERWVKRGVEDYRRTGKL